jgi:hypothetical protein
MVETQSSATVPPENACCEGKHRNDLSFRFWHACSAVSKRGTACGRLKLVHDFVAFNRVRGCHAVAGDKELRLPLRKATPLSGNMAALAQLLSKPVDPTPAQAAALAQEVDGSSAGGPQDENKAPPNGSVASHSLKL